MQTFGGWWNSFGLTAHSWRSFAGEDLFDRPLAGPVPKSALCIGVDFNVGRFYCCPGSGVDVSPAEGSSWPVSVAEDTIVIFFQERLGSS